jgi:hypothetical protein
MADATELAKRWFVGGVAACCGEAATYPLDFAKVRLQLQNELGRTLTGEAAKAKPLGLLGTVSHILRTEGLLAMYGGLSAAALRQFVYGGIGVGLYAPIRQLVIGEGADPKAAPLHLRVLAGALSGSLGQLVANPFDLVKVRIQADGRLKALGQAPRYRGTLDALQRIPREEGLAGFGKGLGPSIGRAAVINGCGIASYDFTKVQVFMLTGQEKGLVPQVLGSLVSGFVSAVVSTPFDVVKTRMMNQPQGVTLYSSGLDCALKTARAEGILGLYKGFLPAYARLAPHRVVHFVTLCVARGRRARARAPTRTLLTPLFPRAPTRPLPLARPRSEQLNRLACVRLSRHLPLPLPSHCAPNPSHPFLLAFSPPLAVACQRCNYI